MVSPWLGFCRLKGGDFANSVPWLGFRRLKGGDFSNRFPWLGFCRLKGGDFANSVPWLGFCRDGNHDSLGDGKGFGNSTPMIGIL